MKEVTTSEAHSSNSTTSSSNEGKVSEVNSSNSATKVSVHMHGKFKTNTVTKLMRKHIRGEPTVTKSNKCHRITGSKFKRLLGNNCVSQPNQTKIVAGIPNQFNDRSNIRFKSTMKIQTFAQVNNFAGILVQIIVENSNVCSGITVQVNNFAGILIQFID